MHDAGHSDRLRIVDHDRVTENRTDRFARGSDVGRGVEIRPDQHCQTASMASSLILRPGLPSDAEAMSILHYHCWLTAFVDLVTPSSAVAEMQPLRNAARFHGWMQPESDVTVTVAVLEGVVAGYAAVSGHEVLHVFIEPDHAGHGIGRRLLAAAEQLLTDAGQDLIELHTMLGNEPAIGLYRSAGWEMTDGIVANDHDGVVYDEHVMTKRLRPRD